MVSIICYTNNTRTLEHSYFTSSQLLRQDISSKTIFQSTDDILSGSFYLVCTSACKLFAATLTTGDVFIFVKRLVHFQLETGKDGCLNLRFGSPKPKCPAHSNIIVRKAARHHD